MKLYDQNPVAMEDEEEEAMIINEIEQVPPIVDDDSDVLPEEETADLPTQLVVTNVAPAIFEEGEAKSAFENLFKTFGVVTIQYFRSFHRALVAFETPQMAASARIQLHQARVGENLINCYFAQSVTPKENKGGPHLQPPAPVKQYLISPPASPPVGWEPREEAEPLVNFDLLSALAGLAPGEPHELHPPTDDQPGIVVIPCEAPAIPGPKLEIVQTRCPERNS